MLWFQFTSFLRTTRSPPCVIIVATVVVASEAPVVASFFGKLLSKISLRRRPQLGTVQVLDMQSFNRWPGLKQLKHSLNFCTCSRCSFSFIDLNFLQLPIACCPSLDGLSEFLGFVESSALDAELLVFVFSLF